MRAFKARAVAPRELLRDAMMSAAVSIQSDHVPGFALEHRGSTSLKLPRRPCHAGAVKINGGNAMFPGRNS